EGCLVTGARQRQQVCLHVSTFATPSTLSYTADRAAHQYRRRRTPELGGREAPSWRRTSRLPFQDAGDTWSPVGERTLMPTTEPHRRLTVLWTAGAYLLVTLDALVLVTALPSIHADLGGGAGNLPWIINAYALTFAAGIITAAALGDRLGRRRMYAGG